jgi:glyoxylase I family protein
MIREAVRPQDTLIMLRSGATVLELFIKPDAPQRVNNPEAMGLRHLAFHVENMDEAVAWLNSRGVETEPVREDTINGGRFTFFKDPDGLPLELHE